MWKVLYVFAFAISVVIANCSILVARDASATLANYQAQIAQIVARTNACQVEMNRTIRQNQTWAPQGRLIPEPQCMSYMPQWISQLAFLETQIERVRGNYTSTLCEITGIVRGCRHRRHY